MFQYGSNMSRRRLEAAMSRHDKYLPPGLAVEIDVIGPARLAGWRLVLDLYSSRQSALVCDIVQAETGDEVWGVLYRLPLELVTRSDGERSVMDRIEGHRTEEDPPNYEPVPVVVAGLEEDEIEATTYVGRSDARKRCATDHADAVVERTYAEAVLRGAREANLPSHYVSFLERTVVPGIDDVGSDETGR